MIRFRFAAVAAALVLVTALLALAGCGGKSSSSSNGGGGSTATVTGVVKDAVSGNALAGASVKPSAGAATTTDANGRFTVTVSAGSAVRLDVTRADHSLNQVVLTLAKNETRAITVNLMAAGTTSNVTVASGGAVTDAASGAKIDFPANFVNASGNVTVTITGLDPTTDQVRALPGGLNALDAGGQPVYLKPVSFAEYTVKDGAGNVLPYNASAGAGANIELPIPTSLRGQPGYMNGDPIECYVYDPSDGKWKTPVPGVIGNSTVDGTTPVIKATIFHLSWYGGAPATSDIACIEGTVTVDGAPAANVYVEAFPGGSTTTDAQGHYQVQATANSTVRVEASVQVGTGFRTAHDEVTTGAAGGPCTHLDLTLGSVVAGAYTVNGFMSSDWLSGLYSGDLVFIIIDVGAGNTSNPVDGAKVEIGTGNTWLTLTGLGSGEYALGSGFAGSSLHLTKGASYTLRFDYNNDGTTDATSTGVYACGNPKVTVPANHATVGKSFTVTYTDSGSAVGGYSPVYVGSVVGDSHYAGFYTGSRSYVLGTGVEDPVTHFPNQPLAADTYEIEVSAGDGPIYRPLLGGSGAPNVTGANTSGTFYSLSEPANTDTVTCTGVQPALARTRLAKAGRTATASMSPELRQVLDRIHADRQRAQSAMDRWRGTRRQLRAKR